MTGPLSINAYAPVVNQAIDSYHERLETEKESYVITDGIGFNTASFILTGSLDYLLDWYANGLVRDVVWKTPEGGIAWHGFVNRLSLTIGGNTRTESVDGMANRILYIYAPKDTSTSPPTVGAQTTITKNDTDLQARYGIKTAIVSGGECTTATADDAALSVLAGLKHVRLGETVTVTAGKFPALKVSMQGYAHMANWYYYTRTQVTGTDDADNIIILVLAADPNGVLSSSDVNIDTCTTAIKKYYDGKKLGWKIILDIANRGYETGSLGYPWAVGVYENRLTTYKQAEMVDDEGVPLSTNQYPALHRHITDPGGSILDDAGKEVLPWELRPDRLLYTEGIPGRPMYIEQVKFTTPFKAVLSGTDHLNPSREFVRSNCK